MAGLLYIAVDLGAGSGRVFLAGFDPESFLLEEIHRFHYPPAQKDGHLRWDFDGIFGHIKTGLKHAADRARDLGRQIASIGADGWGVDYGLLDSDDNLIAQPVCYRDDRTSNAMAEVFAKVSKEEIFEKTGIQFLNFNTIFQLASESEDFDKVSQLLLLPDLVNFYLTGQPFCEFTNATTTQLVNAKSGNWDYQLLESLEIPARLFPKIIPAGTDLGEMQTNIAAETGLNRVRIIAPATHDTGSAIAGAPLEPNEAYISSGTWSLIGVERNSPLINEDTASHNFTNEGGVYGTFRFLKNVMGLWIFESCRKEWTAAGFSADYDSLIKSVADIDGFAGFIYPDDERFLNPPSMTAAIRNQMAETGQTAGDDPAVVSKIIFDSLAFRYASVLETIENLTAEKIVGIQILGGGGRNSYLNQMTADASGLRARAGVTEATVVGNLLVQAITNGRLDSHSEARQYIADNFEFSCFLPRKSTQLADARQIYKMIENRFIL